MIYAVVMGGGKGTRFWPESTNKKPKQFLPMCGEKSMIRQTVDRLKSIINANRILIIGNKRHYNLTRKELKDIPRKNIISEPIGRNTAPCLGLASLIVKRRDPKGVIVAMPADHIIKKHRYFSKLLKAAARYAHKNDNFITFGITPQLPHTGYGYIEICNEYRRDNGIKFFTVKRFIEKPSLDKAKRYLSSGKFYWNSGMFVFNVNTLLRAIKKHMPKLYKGLCRIESFLGTTKENLTIAKVFNSIDAISIDYGIMERVSNCLLVKAEIGWNDIGSWNALDGILKKDKNGNIMRGKCISIKSGRNIIHSMDKLIAVLGIYDSIIVQTNRALLVAHKDHAQDIKKIVEFLERKKENKYL